MPFLLPNQQRQSTEGTVKYNGCKMASGTSCSAKRIQKLNFKTSKHTHIHTQMLKGPLSGTTWLSQYQKKHSPTHTHEQVFSQTSRSTACELILVMFLLSKRGLLDPIKSAYNQSLLDGLLKLTAMPLTDYGSVYWQSWPQCKYCYAELIASFIN